MNKDRLKGQAKDIAGKARRKAGELTDNEKQQAKGLGEQAEGKAQKGWGEVKDAANDAKRNLDRDRDNH